MSIATVQIPLSRPDLSEIEVEEVLGVLRTPWLSMGPKIQEFEARFAEFVGTRHAIAVSNGTCGLHLALRAVGLRRDVEVITTPFSFVATANVVLYEGARPVLVDVDPQTLNLTPETVEERIHRDYTPSQDGKMVSKTTGMPLLAILPVSVFGHPVEMDGFRAVARTYGLRVVHDTCEAFGSLYWSRELNAWVSEATLAEAAVFAFYPNKQITTGEGGMVVTDDDAIATYCRMGRNQGRSLHADWLDHEMLGFNYRMDELSSALGVAQMRRAHQLLGSRQQVAQWYDEALSTVEDVERPQAAPWARVAWFVYVIRVRNGINRDGVIAHLARQGIAAKSYFPPIHLYSHFRALGYTSGQFPVAEDAASRTIALPFFNSLTKEQVDEVIRNLREAIRINVEA